MKLMWTETKLAAWLILEAIAIRWRKVTEVIEDAAHDAECDATYRRCQLEREQIRLLREARHPGT